MEQGFWKILERPIIGFSPMDGITDAACRAITAKYGRPAVVFTEFTAVEGLQAGALRLMEDFLYSEIERPVVAQVFGSEPGAFFTAAVVASALGFDGIDLNMGCPAKNVAQRGAGASLIRDPKRAQEIIRQTRSGTRAWAKGASLQELGVHPRLIPLIEKRRQVLGHLEADSSRRELPVSVKTRIGYDTVVIKTWIQQLQEVEPVAITVHGRTLKQLYSGVADWEAIAQAATVLRGSSTLVLGNGDVQSIEDGLARSKHAGTDGFLIGRAAIGNPWIFQGRSVGVHTRLETAREHARYLASQFGPDSMVRMRKHLLEYTKHFPGAREVRMQLNTVHHLDDIERILQSPSLLD